MAKISFQVKGFAAWIGSKKSDFGEVKKINFYSAHHTSPMWAADSPLKKENNSDAPVEDMSVPILGR
jgi:hypothetical protein